MVSRRGFVMGLGALLGLVLGVATLSATANRIEFVTFSGPVGLPGVTLHAGTYSFEIVDTMSSERVVCVRDRATREPVFLGMTLAVERPAEAASGRSIVLGESARGVAPPILTWYPNGDATGRSFIYPER